MTATDTATTTTIAIPYPATDDLRLHLGIGACRLVLAPGGGDSWLTGTYADPAGALPLHITQEGGSVRITQGQRLEALPRLFDASARLDLRLGTARPFALILETGASDVIGELGGVPLTGLTIRQGAGKAALDFATPNPRALDLLEIAAGAADIRVLRLANAGARQIRAGGGAASYLLDFGGVLVRDVDARISAGMATVTLRVPLTTPATIAATAVLGSVEVEGAFTAQGGTYRTPAADQSPRLAIHASAALGAIHLRAS